MTSAAVSLVKAVISSHKSFVVAAWVCVQHDNTTTPMISNPLKICLIDFTFPFPAFPVRQTKFARGNSPSWHYLLVFCSGHWGNDKYILIPVGRLCQDQSLRSSLASTERFYIVAGLR